MAAAETARLVAELSFKDKMSAGIKSANASIDKLEKKFGKLPGIASRGAKAAGQNIERGIAIGAAAAAGATVWAVNAAIDWESAMAGVNKTIEATPEQLAAIEKGLIGISNKTPIAATDLAAIAEAAGALGIAREDILAFTETVAIIGSTTNVTTDEAATALGQLGNVLKLTGEDYDNFAASLVDLGNKGASTEAQILEITKRSGAAASLIGVAKDQTLGWAAAAANLGLNEELAGTALQNFFIKAMPAFTSGSKTLQEITGKTAKQLKQSFKKDATGALEDFLKSLGKMPKDARLKAVQKMFGKGSGLTRLVLGLADSMDKNLTPSLDTATSAWEANTAATEEAEKRFKTTESQLAILKNNVTNAATTIGTNLLPLVNELASEMTTWLSGHQDEIKRFGRDLAKGIKDAVTWAKQLDWGKITASLEAGVGFAKGIVEAFLKLPPEVISLLAGGFVANKLTGGAISGIFGELAKEAFRAVIPKMMVAAGIVHVNGPVAPGSNGGGNKPTPTGPGKGGSRQMTQPGGEQSTTKGLVKTLVKLAPIAVVVQGDTPKGSRGGAMTDQQLLEDLKKMLAQGRGGENIGGGETVVQAIKRLGGDISNNPSSREMKRGINKLVGDTKSEGIAQRQAMEQQRSAIDGVKQKQAEAVVAFRNAERTFASQKPPQVTVGAVSVAVNVGAANVNRSVTIRRRYGTTGGSRDSDSGHGP